jgi:hypothetical protein
MTKSKVDGRDVAPSAATGDAPLPVMGLSSGVIANECARARECTAARTLPHPALDRPPSRQLTKEAETANCNENYKLQIDEALRAHHRA